MLIKLSTNKYQFFEAYLPKAQAHGVKPMGFTGNGKASRVWKGE
jgi:hypothetical protein